MEDRSLGFATLQYFGETATRTEAIGPLPFHRMKEYPYAPGDSYPTDTEHQRYLRAYNTRISQRR